MARNANDGPVFKNIAANTAAFTLVGGKYGVTAVGTITSVGLERLAADGTTWAPVHTALSAAGYVVVEVPQGAYRLGVTGSGVYADVSAIIQ